MLNFILSCTIFAAQPFTPYEAQLWQMISDYRQSQSLPAYRYSAELSRYARHWTCEYPHVVEDRVGSGGSVYHYRGVQHAPPRYYPDIVTGENAWMYAPSLSAVLYGIEPVAGWIDSESHRQNLLADDRCAGVSVMYGRYPTPTIAPVETGPIAVVFLTGDC